MSSSGPTPSINSYGQVWGGSLVSTFLGCCIYGITIAQTFYYFNHYSSDRLTWKVLVASIFVLDTSSLACVMYSLYYYLVASWGIPEMTAPDVKPFPTEYAISSFTVFMVQVFYINTIRSLQAPHIVTITLLTLSLVALGTGLILPVLQLQLKLIYTIVVAPLNHIAFNIARGSALACDLGIVAALCWLLGLRKTDVKRANNMINWLILIAVQRGVLQAIIQMGEVLAYAIKPSGVFFIPFHVIVTRIYCVSLLSSLNSREYIASKLVPTHIRNRQDDQGESGAIPTASVTPQVERRGRSTIQVGASMLSSFIEPPFLESSGEFSASRHTATSTRQTTSTRHTTSTRQTTSTGQYEADDDEPAFPPGVPLPRKGSLPTLREGRNEMGQSLNHSNSDHSLQFEKEGKDSDTIEMMRL